MNSSAIITSKLLYADVVAIYMLCIHCRDTSKLVCFQFALIVAIFFFKVAKHVLTTSHFVTQIRTINVSITPRKTGSAFTRITVTLIGAAYYNW